MKFDNYFKLSPYSLNKEKKHHYLNTYLQELTRLHYSRCSDYRSILNAMRFEFDSNFDFYAMPFIPVSLFKMFNLLSIPKEQIFKTMTSSGTSGQAVSKIFLDKSCALNQSKVLANIVCDLIGKSRTPMIIIDTPSVLKDRNHFSARGSGILGFSIFGTKKIFALDDNMNLNIDLLLDFIKNNQDKKILLFGFTFMIYQHFIKSLVEKNINVDLSNCILIHGGGWKKLVSESIGTTKFRELLYQTCGIKSVHDYYGMVEQTGSIYIECSHGYLHSSIYSDVIIRNANDFSEVPNGKKGIIQTLSILPTSYPGHSLLTEDEGIIEGEDTCKCGRLGKYFKVIGRLKNAELRGCSDVYASEN